MNNLLIRRSIDFFSSKFILIIFNFDQFLEVHRLCAFIKSRKIVFLFWSNTGKISLFM